jgi:hypothetical protein
MSPELDEALEYDALRNFAWNHGFFAQVHRNFNPLLQRPGREHACWYLQRSKKFGGEHEPTILKYSTAAEIYDWINEYRRTESPKS